MRGATQLYRARAVTSEALSMLTGRDRHGPGLLATDGEPPGLALRRFREMYPAIEIIRGPLVSRA